MIGRSVYLDIEGEGKCLFFLERNHQLWGEKGGWEKWEYDLLFAGGGSRKLLRTVDAEHLKCA